MINLKRMEMRMWTIEAALNWVPLVLMGVAILELAWLQRLKRAWDWRESLTSVVISIGQRIARLGGTAVYGGVFLWVWEHRCFTIPINTAWGIALLFFLQEFFYYWEHRLSHESRWFWASHVVHHSPNHLNLSAAYRLSWTAPFTGQTLIFLPMVWIGFHPLAVFGMVALNLLYQFWIHTELVPKLGWFDRIFNSPSNHRVHHAANLRYLDANYGGVLIIFDRIFGTWVPETEPCRFGLVQPMKSNNPLVVQFAEWLALGRDLMRHRNWHTRFNLLFRAPGWQPGDEGKTTAQLRAAARHGSPERQARTG
jgi:sterol desaturase/sphingolipid hydroxylase (fatty acid hydroxylase superfamily)